jgi:4-amino-4-deoxy-L-arabinose transferase-like glycosyltransferase
MAWSDHPDSDNLSRLGLLLLALTSALYLIGLDRFPVVFGGDEAHFAVHAESLARSGRDLNGAPYPIFFRISDPLVPNQTSGIWYQPLLFYAMAPFVWLFGVSEWTARLPVALIAVVDVWLVYAIGRRFFGDRRFALIAAALMALTPAHVIVSRQALDYIAPLPFVLGWFLCLLRYLDTGRVWHIAAGGLLLGAALFSYIAAWLLMPIHVVLTVFAIWRSPHQTRARAVLACVAGFAVPLVLLVVALTSNPEMLANTLVRYQVGGPATPRPGLAERVALYWDYFNPSFLFFAGGSNPTQATSRVGVFLLALLPLMAIGVREIAMKGAGQAGIALLAFAAAPIPIALTMPPAAAYSIARAMTLLPFGILIAVYGLQAMMRGPRLRLFAIALLVAVPLQFATFARDYRGDYQLRAAPRLDPANVRGIAEAVIDYERGAPVPAVYLSDRLDDGGVRWLFFMLQRGRMDLWEKSRSLNLAATLPAIAPGALVVCDASDPRTANFLTAGYQLVRTIAGVAGDAASVVLKAPG